MKKITRYINHNLRLIVHWLRVNKISLIFEKTKIVLFPPKEKDIAKKLNFRISGQKYISPKKWSIYVFSWSSHISMLKAKLSRENGRLAKLRYFTLTKLLAAICKALFESHMRCGCQISGQTNNEVPQPYKNFLEKLLVSTITTQERCTTIKLIYLKLEPLIMDLKQ